MIIPAPATPPPPLHPLVTGGARDIDSHMARRLVRRGCDVGTLDKLSTGHRNAPLGGAFALSALYEVAMKPNRDSARPPKQASNGRDSAKAGGLIPFTSKRTRTAVTP